MQFLPHISVLTKPSIVDTGIYQEVEHGEDGSSSAGSDADVTECVELLLKWDCCKETCKRLLVKRNSDVLMLTHMSLKKNANSNGR
jgi:hypothetical protein